MPSSETRHALGPSVTRGSVRSSLTEQEHSLLHDLRQRLRPDVGAKPVAQAAPSTPGQRAADAVALAVGSWRFLIIQSALLVVWIAFNVIGWVKAWDPYPFILLNLMLSFQAAYTAPVLLMSQNRQANVDRMAAQTDYDVNVKAQLEIELLHQKIDMMREQEVARLLTIVERLEARLESLSPASAA